MVFVEVVKTLAAKIDVEGTKHYVVCQTFLQSCILTQYHSTEF